jgi:hypothetical protein
LGFALVTKKLILLAGAGVCCANATGLPIDRIAIAAAAKDLVFMVNSPYGLTVSLGFVA